jgi:hypothetical protein
MLTATHRIRALNMIQRRGLSKALSCESFISCLYLSRPSILLPKLIQDIKLSTMEPVTWPSSLSILTMLSRIVRQIPKSEYKAKEYRQYINPNRSSQLLYRQSELLPAVVFRNFQVLFGVIRNHSVHFFHDCPLHAFFVIDCPEEYRALRSFDLVQEFVAKGSNHNFLEHVESHARNFQKLPGV